MSSLLSLWPTLVLAAPLSAQSYRLSTPFPPGPVVGDAYRSVISADGRTVVYQADQEEDQVFGLFSVPSDGSAAPVQLVTNEVGWDFAISPDDRWLVYRQGSLFSVPLQGGAPPVRLTTSGDVYAGRSRFSAPTERVVFLARAGGAYRLYSAPVDGSAPARELSHALAAGVEVEDLRVSPDGLHALYLARRPGVEAELRCVPVDGSSAAVRLMRATAPADFTHYDGYGSQFDFGPDGARVVFRVDMETDGVIELYSVPRDGSAPALKISGTRAAGETLREYGLGLAGGRIAYRTEIPGAGPRLWSAPIDGSAAPVELTTSAILAAFRFTVDAPGTRVAFHAYGPSAWEIFTVPIDASAAPVQISASLPGNPASDAFAFTPDGSRLVYAAPEDVTRYDLYAAPSDGAPGRVKLSGPGGGLSGFMDNPLTSDCFALTADGTCVVYYADPQPGAGFGLFSARIDGGSPLVELLPPVPSSFTNATFSFRIAASGERVAFNRDHETYDVVQVYGVPIDGSSAPIRLNAPLPSPASDDVIDCLVTSDARTAVYRDQQGVHAVAAHGLAEPEALTTAVALHALSPDGRWLVYSQGSPTTDLFSRPVDGSSAPVQLSGPYAPPGAYGAGAYHFRIGPDSSRVVYRANQDLNTSFDLYAVPIDGSAPSVNVSGVGGGGVRLQTFEIGPDGTCLVYRADPDNDGAYTLFRAPLDGSAPPVALSAGAGVDVESFRLTPDGAHVVYVAHFGSSDRLYAVPSAGGTAPTLLAGPLVAYGDVHAFEITPDGLGVVYRADQVQNEVVELFRVPLDASAAPLALHPPLVAGGDVTEHLVARDGSCVVFRADYAADEVFELFRVGATGGVPLRLNAPLPLNGDVTPGLALRRDAQVVYRADQEVNNRHELFEAPLDGSSPPCKLSAPLQPDGDVLDDFRIAEDGRRVLYRADQESDDVVELFAATDATSPVRRVNGALVAGGDVQSFQIGADGRRAFYLADQDADEVVELFVGVLSTPPVQRAP